MAKYVALKSFTGIAQMKKGDVKAFNDDEQWVKDLVSFGFIEKVKPPRAPRKKAQEAEAKEEPKKKATKKKTTKKAKAEEDTK